MDELPEYIKQANKMDAVDQLQLLEIYHSSKLKELQKKLMRQAGVEFQTVTFEQFTKSNGIGVSRQFRNQQIVLSALAKKGVKNG